MVNRPFLKHQYHKLLVGQVGESSLILYLLFSIARMTILFIVQAEVMLRVKEAPTVQVTREIERNQLCPRWTGNVWLPYPLINQQDLLALPLKNMLTVFICLHLHCYHLFQAIATSLLYCYNNSWWICFDSTQLPK